MNELTRHPRAGLTIVPIVPWHRAPRHWGPPELGSFFHTNEKCMLNNGTCKNARLACTSLLVDCRVQSQSMQYVFGENRGYIDRMMGFGPLWATAMYERGHLASLPHS